jgi:heme-degrading monooxygenase HmoA
MPVLELLLLRLRPGISPTDPTLVQNLSTVRSLVHTNSRFYQCIEDASLVYILGQWPSLAAHQAFLASPEREAILSHQTHQLDFRWMVHLDVPEGKTIEDALPFAAPVLNIAKTTFTAPGAGEVDAYKRVRGVRWRSKIVDATRPYPLFEGWRIDAPEGEAEHVVLTGWESVEAHFRFTKSTREAGQEYASLGDRVEGVEGRHARNMEASQGLAEGDGSSHAAKGRLL